MTREKMIEDVIRKFGFEHKATIRFCRMCENLKLPNLFIIIIYIYYMNK